MKEVLRTGNILAMQILRQMLADEGIETILMDEHSGALFGGVGGIGPRLMVIDEGDFEKALAIIEGSGLVG